jgi:4-hydroxythreonine-4-phosphate dehydrogenase
MKKPIIGITCGDINGIGPEIILKTFQDERLFDLCRPVFYGHSKVLAFHREALQLEEVKTTIVENASHASEGHLSVVNCWTENANVTLGQVTEEGGKYAWKALDKAMEDIKAGHLRALVTAPINKKAMQLAAFPHPGHTEYLAAQIGAADMLMLMVNDNLRVGMVTTHVPLGKVSSNINRDRIIKKLELLNRCLQRDFGIQRPNLAVLGLNPHAGEEGAIGNEEQQHIAPAIAQARKQGLLAFGPYAADGFFGSGAFAKHDAVLAMYHDQGLIPFKALSFHQGVNYTAGLPFVRTSPDHGTGYDIAGQNLADPSSFRTALFTAIEIARQRAKYDQWHADSIRKGQRPDDLQREIEVGGDDGVIRDNRSASSD